MKPDDLVAMVIGKVVWMQICFLHKVKDINSNLFPALTDILPLQQHTHKRPQTLIEDLEIHCVLYHAVYDSLLILLLK
jgi:hypothetical protein